MVVGRRKYDHISDVLSGRNWLTSKQLSEYHSLTLAQRIRRWGEPDDLASLFSRNSAHRARSTRRDNQFHLPGIRTESGRRQFAYRVPRLYNSLPTELTALGIDSFKRNLRALLKGEEETA